MILYFSGTGNSKFVADALAHAIGDTVTDMQPYMKESRTGNFSDAKPYVIVFPVYVSGIPGFIRRFLLESSFSGTRSIYFIATAAGSSYGSCPNYAAYIAEKKGLKYMGCELIQMPQNYLPMFSPTPQEEQRHRFKNALNSIQMLALRITNEQPFTLKPASSFEYALTKLTDRAFIKAAGLFGKFSVSDTCISCGKCAAICPANNIRMQNGKPTWGKKCVQCMACFNRCPRSAIEIGRKTVGVERYTCTDYHKYIQANGVKDDH